MSYCSDIYAVGNTSKPFTITLDKLAFGRYLRLDLYGRYQTQPIDQKYYTVIQSVKCHGLPVGADFKCEFPAIYKSLMKVTKYLNLEIDNSAISDDPGASFLERKKQRTELNELLNHDQETLISVITSVKKSHWMRSRSYLEWILSVVKNQDLFLNDYFNSLFTERKIFNDFEAVIFTKS
ncbi:hypothetical protein HK096_002199, partial [Nowakowskiella sp. JEL0078]